jgi:uncharacterized membrane protein
VNGYPEAVGRIVTDYLERVRAQLRLVPAVEQDEFLREIQSHLYDAYQQMPGQDDVARILAVLRNFGEPAEVVAGRLPGAMVRSGARRNLPLYVVGGIFIALFGIPLGAGGAGVLVGLLCALAGVLIAYFATVGSILLVGSLLMLLGAVRFLLPHLWDQLVAMGFIQIGPPVAEFWDRFSSSEQALMLIMIASIFAAAGLGGLWLGKYMIRGLRFLFVLAFDWMRRGAQRIRRGLHRGPREVAGRAATATGFRS